MNKRYLLLLACCFFLYACSSSKALTGGKIKPMTAAALNAEIQKERLDYQTLSCKAKIHLQTPDVDQSFSAQIEIQRDSFIGISLRVLNYEGARILLTPDSLKIIDRIHHTYYLEDYSYLEKQYDVSIDFSALEELIAGNPLYYDSASLQKADAVDKYILLSQSGVYNNTLWLYPSFALMRMFIRDTLRERDLTLDYGDYDKIHGQVFAFNRKINVRANVAIDAGMQISQLILDEPLEFDFTINPHYRKMD